MRETMFIFQTHMEPQAKKEQPKPQPPIEGFITQRPVMAVQRADQGFSAVHKQVQSLAEQMLSKIQQA